MDSSFESKINKFSSHIMNNAQKKLEELETEIALERKAKTEQSNNEFSDSAYKEIQDEILKIQKKDNEKIRAAELEAKKILLQKREALINDIFESARKKLNDFKESEEYKKWLNNKIEKAIDELGEGSKELYLLSDDIEIVANDFKDITVIKTEEKDFWGGVRLKNKDKGIIADYSFYELLESQRTDFLQKSGLMLD